MKSLINPKAEITKDNWTVSVVERGLHLYLVVETLGFEKDPGYKMRVYDFLPEDRNALHLESVTQIFNTWRKNESLKAMIRENVIDQYYDNTSREDTEKDPTIVVRSREELFRHHAWNVNEVKTWVCPSENIKKMVESIRLDQNSDLTFKYRGKGGDLNCTYWAETKLVTAGIKPHHHHPLVTAFAKHPGTLTHGHHPHLGLLFNHHKHNYPDPGLPVSEPYKISFKH